MLKKLLLITATVAAASMAAQASATERYRVVTPVVVSDNLTTPWINQLTDADLKKRGVRRVKVPINAAPAQAGQRVVPVVMMAPARHPLFGGPQQVSYQPAERPSSTRLDPKFLPQEVSYDSKERPGTLVIDTINRFLYLVEGNGKARRYGVGVGKPGFEWAGVHKVTRKAEWPDWTPPKEMIAREAKKGHILPARMDGGEGNPLGARAMYIGSTEYRIHGTNAPWTIGYAVSSGCIRMRNEDVTDLYDRVKVGTKVIVQ
jgi:lipoprotein-anchoring transpeptidase ErfK/SrfK